MKVHKGLIELMGYAQIIGGYSVVPLSIDADDTNCAVEFQIFYPDDSRKKIVRKGKHKNFVFTTSVENIPFTINLETGVIKKVRKK